MRYARFSAVVLVALIGSSPLLVPGAAPLPDPPPRLAVQPLWVGALPVRSVGETEVTARTAKVGVVIGSVEGYPGLFYCTDQGYLAWGPAPRMLPKKYQRAPRWNHGSALLVRPTTKGRAQVEAKKHTIEAYLDQEANTWIYLTASGAIAVLPLREEPKAGAEFPLLYGLDLKVRESGSFDFPTPSFGVDVYHDKQASAVVYVTEKDTIAVAPYREVRGTPKAPDWKQGLELKVRPVDQLAFKGARRFGAEVFLDLNTGYLLTITETGAFAAMVGEVDEQKAMRQPTEWRAGLKWPTSPTTSAAAELYLNPAAKLLIVVSEKGGLAVFAP
jgi:hypothetical protein